MKLNFEQNGFIIIKNALNTKDINHIKKIINKSSNSSYEKFLNQLRKNKKKLFDYVLPFHKEILFLGLYEKILMQTKVFKILKELLGSDLAHHEDPSIAVNISGLDSSKKNYLYKKWHQELWSGSSTSTLAFWTPIFLPKNKSGQIEVIKGSHTWGHIPHNNREPISLPKKYEIQSINLNEGDVLLFHSLLLHRSKKIVSERFDARLALITHIRNFKHINNSFDLNKSWRIFNMSELTKVEKKLGNHYLSPYRITAID